MRLFWAWLWGEMSIPCKRHCIKSPLCVIGGFVICTRIYIYHSCSNAIRKMTGLLQVYFIWYISTTRMWVMLQYVYLNNNIAHTWLDLHIIFFSKDTQRKIVCHYLLKYVYRLKNITYAWDNFYRANKIYEKRISSTFTLIILWLSVCEINNNVGVILWHA